MSEVKHVDHGLSANNFETLVRLYQLCLWDTLDSDNEVRTWPRLEASIANEFGLDEVQRRAVGFEAAARFEFDLEELEAIELGGINA